MSLKHFDDNCDGCQPVLLDPKTGKQLSKDHPAMKAVNAAFKSLSKEQKESFHRVCCQNSRDEHDLATIKEIQEQVQKALTN